jgi:hypothetical protein
MMWSLDVTVKPSLGLGLTIAPALVLLFVAAGTNSLHAGVIYSDNFNDNTNTGWTYLDRSGGTTLSAEVGGGPGAPSFAEQNGRLEQTATNYSFPRYDGPYVDPSPSLGGIALSGSGVITASQYTISATFDSLEEGNTFSGPGNRLRLRRVKTTSGMLWTSAPGTSNPFRLIQVDNGVLTVHSQVDYGSTFSHDPTSLLLEVDTVTGTVTGTYGTDAPIVMATGLTIAAGQNGVGSNNDAFAIDDYVITVIPEPASLSGGLLGLALIACRRRRAA